MSLSNFLHFNKSCPICGEPLSLYMRWCDSVLFKATQANQLSIFFPTKYRMTDKNLVDWKEATRPFGNVIMDNTSGYPQISFDTSTQDHIHTEAEALKRNIFFFYICNSNGIQELKYDKNDYQIQLYDACYYRSTPFMEFKKYKDDDGVEWKQINSVVPEHEYLDNLEEAFCFTDRQNEIEKVYYLKFDYESNTAKLWHYVTNEEQRNQVNFKPKIFESKDLPMSADRPKFGIEDREQLLNKFRNWIVMS
jgi:hypothetical protein